MGIIFNLHDLIWDTITLRQIYESATNPNIKSYHWYAREVVPNFQRKQNRKSITKAGDIDISTSDLIILRSKAPHVPLRDDDKSSRIYYLTPSVLTGSEISRQMHAIAEEQWKHIQPGSSHYRARYFQSSNHLFHKEPKDVYVDTCFKLLIHMYKNTQISGFARDLEHYINEMKDIEAKINRF